MLLSNSQGQHGNKVLGQVPHAWSWLCCSCPALSRRPFQRATTKVPPQLVQGGLQERAATASLPVGRSIPTKIWATTKNSSWEHQV